MKIKVKVITKSSENKVEYDEKNDIYRVKLTLVPEKGKANKKIIELLAKYLDTNKSNISITTGESSDIKTVEIK